MITYLIFIGIEIVIYFCYLLKVSKERGEQLAVEYGIKFMETSAKASVNVEEAFHTLARDIKTKTEKKLVSLMLLPYLPITKELLCYICVI